MADVSPLSSVEIPSLEGKVGAEEWKVRVDLAAAYRLIAITAGTISSSPTCRPASPGPSTTSS
jgi:hypothetical protein